MDLLFWKQLVASVLTIISKSKSHLFWQIKFLLRRIRSCSHITSSESDLAFTQFLKFLDESSSTLLSALKKIHAGVRLDEFYFETVKVGVNCRVLSKVMIFIFTLGHGQTSIERGFSINSNMLSERNFTCLSSHYQQFHGVQQIKGSPSGNQHRNDKGC